MSGIVSPTTEARKPLNPTEILPPEMWYHILSFPSPVDEFPVALVCKLFAYILRKKREKRGECKWLTPITPFCSTMESFLFVRSSMIGVSSERCVNTKLVMVLARMERYDLLVQFVSSSLCTKDDTKDLYKKLMWDGEFDVFRRLWKMHKLLVPEDGILHAICSDQYYLVRLLRFEYPHYRIPYEKVPDAIWAAIDTNNIENVRIAFDLTSPGDLEWMKFELWHKCIVVGNPEILKFCIEKLGRIPLHPDFIKRAWFLYRAHRTQEGLDVLEYLIAYGCLIEYRTYLDLKHVCPVLAATIPRRQIVQAPVAPKPPIHVVHYHGGGNV